jgi:XTP/dITP diphosphohydrolase
MIHTTSLKNDCYLYFAPMLIFATNNQHKIKEVKALLPEGFQVHSLEDIDCDDELPETSSTIKANALQKALYVSEKFGVDCFADDSGLEVDALGGEPGVYSARYAGPKATSQQNIDRLLKELKGEQNRAAQFRTIIALMLNNEQHFFEGIIRGRITEQMEGTHGFGYDAVFIPDGYDKTFAEMKAEEKNAISHRGIAVRKLVEFLSKLSKS